MQIQPPQNAEDQISFNLFLSAVSLLLHSPCLSVLRCSLPLLPLLFPICLWFSVWSQLLCSWHMPPQRNCVEVRGFLSAAQLQVYGLVSAKERCIFLGLVGARSPECVHLCVCPLKCVFKSRLSGTRLVVCTCNNVLLPLLLLITSDRTPAAFIASGETQLVSCQLLSKRLSHQHIVSSVI